MRLALYGGTFDPVHEAHLALARQALARLALDRVLFVPAAHPPHKAGVTRASFEDRMRMIELACAGEPAFAASRLEEGEARSYSILTIEKVRATLPAGETLYFLIGSDAFAEIRSWLRWRDVCAAVEFIVASRPGHPYDVPAEAKVHRLDGPGLDISSSHIRDLLARGVVPPEVPAPVGAYIREHGLYLPAAHRVRKSR